MESRLLSVAENRKIRNQRRPPKSRLAADGSPWILPCLRGASLWTDGIVSGLWNAHFVLHDLHHAHPYDEWKIE
jgi:hypothetical protein